MIKDATAEVAKTTAQTLQEDGPIVDLVLAQTMLTITRGIRFRNDSKERSILLANLLKHTDRTSPAPARATNVDGASNILFRPKHLLYLANPRDLQKVAPRLEYNPTL